MYCKRSENIRIEYYGSGLPALPGIPDVVNVLLWYCLPIPDEVDQLGNVHTLLWAVHGGKQIVLSCPGQWWTIRRIIRNTWNLPPPKSSHHLLIQ